MHHVLILPSWYPGHSGDIYGIFFREHAIALKRYGHKVGVIYPNLYSLREWRRIFSDDFEINEEKDNGINTLRSHGMAWFPKIPRANDWVEFKYGLRLYEKYISKFGKPDILHVQSMLNAGLLAKYIKEIEGIPYVISEHSSRFATGKLSSYKLKTSKQIASKADLRFGVSKSLCHDLQNLLGLDSGKWDELPNMVERSFLETALEKNNKPGKNFRFVTVASLDENKSVDNIIKAFTDKFKTETDIFLDIVGDGSDRSILEILTDELKMSDRIVFHGKLSRDDVKEVMKFADSLVLASRYETFGVVAIESLALGKPVVATKCGGPESIIRKEDGILVPTDDIKAIADAMMWMYQNYDQYDSANIQDACRARFSEEVIVGKWTEVYEKAIKTQVNK